MSCDLNVFLARSEMPTPERWAQAIVDAGLDVQLDTDFDVESFTGFLPCKYKGIDSGFEYYSDTLTAEDLAEMEITAAHDFSVTFTTGSDMRELITSLISAGVLCKTSGDTFFDPQSDESYSAGQILDWVRGEVAECEKDL